MSAGALAISFTDFGVMVQFKKMLIEKDAYQGCASAMSSEPKS
jgi:hypothetical protein